jgi:hypothetical protein
MRLWSKVISQDRMPVNRDGEGVSKKDAVVSMLNVLFLPGILVSSQQKENKDGQQ